MNLKKELLWGLWVGIGLLSFVISLSLIESTTSTNYKSFLVAVEIGTEMQA